MLALLRKSFSVCPTTLYTIQNDGEVLTNVTTTCMQGSTQNLLLIVSSVNLSQPCTISSTTLELWRLLILWRQKVPNRTQSTDKASTYASEGFS